MQVHEVADLFPPMSEAEFRELVDDIREHGQREPIWTANGYIIDGRHRFKACQELGIRPKTREWDGEGSLTSFAVSLNLHRRHLDESQRALIGARLKPMFEEEAQVRMLFGKQNPVANLPQGRSRDQAAALVNVSPRSVESASRVLAKGSPELVEAVGAGKVAVSTAAALADLEPEEQTEIVARGEKEILAKAKELRQAKIVQKRRARTEMHRAIAEGNRALDFSDRRFAVIQADPPWEYDNGGVNGAAQNHYPTMTIEDIVNLSVEPFATDDAALFLWVPNALLCDGIRVCEAWGFEYRTSFVWVKEGPPGTGFYNFQDHELLLVAVRGSNMTPVIRRSSVIRAPKGAHSAKPEEAYQIIEEMYPDAPRLELFARAERPGWESWGNQAQAQSA